MVRSAFLLAIVAGASVAHGAVTRYPDKNTFLASIRGNAFNGGSYTSAALQFSATNYVRASNGWSVAIDASASNNPLMLTCLSGAGSAFDGPSTVITAADGRAASAASFTLGVINTSVVPIDADVVISTDTGESFTVSAPAAGVRVSFTTSAPFSRIFLNTTAVFQQWETVDDVVLGDAINLPDADNCVGAVAVREGTFNMSNLHAGADLYPWNRAASANFPAGADTWFDYYPTASGTASVTTNGGGFDTVVAVYIDSCPTSASVADFFNDDFYGLLSRVDFPVLTGHHYLVRVGGFNYGEAAGPRRGNAPLAITLNPCHADYNNDGIVDFFDYLDFVSAFAAGCP